MPTTYCHKHQPGGNCQILRIDPSMPTGFRLAWAPGCPDTPCTHEDPNGFAGNCPFCNGLGFSGYKAPNPAPIDQAPQECPFCVDGHLAAPKDCLSCPAMATCTHRRLTTGCLKTFALWKE